MDVSEIVGYCCKSRKKHGHLWDCWLLL